MEKLQVTKNGTRDTEFRVFYPSFRLSPGFIFFPQEKENYFPHYPNFSRVYVSHFPFFRLKSKSTFSIRDVPLKNHHKISRVHAVSKRVQRVYKKYDLLKLRGL